MDKQIAMGRNLWETEPVGDGFDKSFIDARMLEVYQWCASTDAKSSAKRLLRKYRLPLDGEELLADAQAAAVQAIHRRPENFESFNPAAYCMRIMENLAKRLLSRRPDLAPVSFDEVSEWLPALDEPTPAVFGKLDIERLLVAIETHGRQPVHVSAAITAVYLQVRDDIAIDDAPWPKAGVTQGRRESWPALWIATRDAGLFPNPARRRPDGKARQRQRLLEAINGLLAKAHLHIITEGPR